MPDKIFDLLIQGREGVVFQGKVESLTSINEEGEFDILPEHANFISLIKEKIKFKEVGGEIKEVDIDSGLLRTKENKVEIYLGVEGFAAEETLDKDSKSVTQ